jgi:NAD(P)-dependent dehydrogenase (short-subunit alcohol dehydrogenase family)
MTYCLYQRTILITGSTGGLGRVLASALRAKGAKLALLDINLEGAAAQARELGDPEFVQAWQADVRSLHSLEAAVAGARQHFGGIDVVIANAGIDVVAPMESIDPVVFERVIDINLNGVWRTFRAALPQVRERKGYLLAISSMAAFVHSPLQAHYTASKAGVWAMCDSIRLELRHQGVGVGSVHPTFFQTPMMEKVHADKAGVKLWGGNQNGLWKMIAIDEVVDGIVRGIENRSDMVVLPRRNTLVAKAAGLFRPVVELLGFKQAEIKEAIALSGKS